MQKNKMMGSQGISFGELIIIVNGASVVGKKEGQSPLGQLFDHVGKDDMFGAKTWEEAEREFRFPLEYGNQRPLSSTWTVTGSGAFLLSDASSKSGRAKITGLTSGKIVDYGIKDSMNMGVYMAPGTC